MKRSFLIIALATLTLSVAPVFANKKEEAAAREAQLQQTYDNLRREVEALKKMKADKLDQIEALETKRWEERYRQNQSITDHQEAVRALDGRYSKASTDLGRLNDQLVQERNATEELKAKATDAKQAINEIALQVQQVVDKAATDLSSDYPIGLEVRNLGFSQSREALNGTNPQIAKSLSLFFDAYANRYALTLSQELVGRNSQIGNKAEVPVNRLRLGTVFLAEAARGGREIQALQRTGALQGRVYEWRADLSDVFSKELQEAITGASRKDSVVWVPLDVLQNKNVQSTTRKNKELTITEKVKDLIRSGGPIMYPLLLLGLVALLFSLDRWLTFLLRGRISSKLVERVHSLVNQGKIAEAQVIASKDKSSLGSIFTAILEHAKDPNRANAEKSVRQILLREQPLLERRMGLLGAFGTAAPLLGLLGTVGGMIALFTVLTDVGTNDAKMLAGGIAEALVCTESGLVIAIPVLLLHGWLTEKLDVITSSLAFQSIALLNQIWPDSEEEKGA